MSLQSIIYLIAFFFIYSFFGWVLESVTKTVSQKKFVNSGFLFGPFCPIYGIGAALMILILKSFQGNYVLTFLISFIIFSIWEYFVGWLLEKMFNTKYWDYSYYKFQIKGRVCLVNSLTWGFLGVAFTELIHPVTMYAISNLSTATINLSVIILTIYIAIDICISIIKIKNINLRINKFNEITNTIKEKLEELKEMTGKAKNKEKLKKAIEELKNKQQEIKEALDKQTERLRSAFPNMKFEKLNEILRKKIDFGKSKKD